MSGHEILIAVMAVFAVLGALDRIFGNRFGLGKEFEEGILAMGSLAMAMIGVICLAPVLAAVLKPIVVPVFGFLGADGAMFAGTILACDMGGGPLAEQMAGSREAALLGGVITGSMLGATVVFTIPVALGILEEEDRPAMAKGVLCGIVTIPLGGLVGFLVAAGNFFSLAVVATIAADKAEAGDPASGQKLMKSSYPIRLLAMAGVLILCAKSGVCDVIALVLPLLFVRPILTIAEFFRKKGV